MAVDNETKPSYLSIAIMDDVELLKKSRKAAEENSLNDNDEKQKWIYLNSDEDATTDGVEFYFEPNDNELNITCSLNIYGGRADITINIPLSDAVLIDILEHNIKRLNKLKTVLEAIR